jgi:hypothetical protein
MARTDEQMVLGLLAKRIAYNPYTGEFTWAPRDGMSKTWNARFLGKPAGCQENRGGGRLLLSLWIHNKTVLVQASRLAWFITHGKTPTHYIDHINGNVADNRIVNLRDVPMTLNQRNIGRKPGAGVAGVGYFRRYGMWRARIWKDGRDHHLGYYQTKEEAERVASLAREVRGFTARHIGKDST